MKTNKNIEDIFRSALENHESKVDPAIWQNVSQSIGGAAVGGAGSTSLLAKLGVMKIAGIVLGAAATVGVLVTVLNKEEKPENNQVVEQTKEKLSENIITENESFSKETAEIQITESENSQVYDEVIDQVSKSTVAELNQDLNSDSNPIENNTSDPLPEDDIHTSASNNSSNEPTSSEDDPKSDNGPENEELPSNNPKEELKPLKALFSFEMISAEGKPNFRFTALANDGAEYNWNLGDGTALSGRVVEHEYEEPGEYPVTLEIERDDEVQTKQIPVKAFLDPVVVVPDIFTPNYDNLNQFFDVMAQSKNVSLVSIVIYDQNNSIVFQGNSNNYKWDGNNMNGDICPEGNYLYLIKFVGDNGNPVNKGGTVYLKR